MLELEPGVVVLFELDPSWIQAPPALLAISKGDPQPRAERLAGEISRRLSKYFARKVVARVNNLNFTQIGKGLDDLHDEEYFQHLRFWV